MKKLLVSIVCMCMLALTVGCNKKDAKKDTGGSKTDSAKKADDSSKTDDGGKTDEPMPDTTDGGDGDS